MTCKFENHEKSEQGFSWTPQVYLSLYSGFFTFCVCVEIIWFLRDSLHDSSCLCLEQIVPCCALCNLFPFPFWFVCPFRCSVNSLTLSFISPFPVPRTEPITHEINACLNRNLTQCVIWKIFTSQLVLEQFDICICFSLLLLCVRHGLCSRAQIRFKYVAIKIFFSIICGEWEKRLLNTWHQIEEIFRAGLQFYFMQDPLIILTVYASSPLPATSQPPKMVTGVMWGFGLYS